MVIKELKLTNYRNHAKLKLSFDPLINLVIGDNGTGKTNILESIEVLATTKSFRARYDRDLILLNKEYTSIEGILDSDNEDDVIELQITKSPLTDNTSSKKAKINKVSKTLSSFSHFLKCVMFSPEDIEIVTGTPSQRRRYLDLVLFQVDTKYKKAISGLHATIKRRNKILESIRETGGGREQLPFWNAKLIEYSEYIQQKREMFVSYTNSRLQKNGRHLARYAKDITLSYQPNLATSARLEEYCEREIAAKTTLIGPHRDDFHIVQNNGDMAYFASRGEQRTAVFLIKLAEYTFIENLTGIKPILLLDDIFSELDEAHKESIIAYINEGQTIITSANEQDIPPVSVSKTIRL